jgi:hypothetical protein
MIVLVSAVSAFSRAGDSGPKCVFAIFRPGFWPGTSGYFSWPKSPAPRDRRLRPKSLDLQNSRCRSAQRWGRRLFSPCPESPPSKGQRLRRKWPATAIFVGRPIKGPLLPPWAVATPSLSPPLLTLSSLPSLLHSSHAS